MNSGFTSKVSDKTDFADLSLPNVGRLGLPWGDIFPVWDQDGQVNFYSFIPIKDLGFKKDASDFETVSPSESVEDMVDAEQVTQPKIDLRQAFGARMLPAVEAPDMEKIWGFESFETAERIAAEELVYLNPSSNIRGNGCATAWTHLRLARPANANDASRAIEFYAQRCDYTLQQRKEPPAGSRPGQLIFELAQTLGRLMLSAALGREDFVLVSATRSENSVTFQELSDLDVNFQVDSPSYRCFYPLLRVSGGPLPEGKLGWKIISRVRPADKSWASATQTNIEFGSKEKQLKDGANNFVDAQKVEAWLLGIIVQANEILGEDLNASPNPLHLANLARPVVMSLLAQGDPWLTRVLIMRKASEFG